MKVKEIIKELQKQDPEQEIYLSSDDEGNSYRLMTEVVSAGIIQCGNEYEFYYTKLTPILMKKGFTEEDIRKDATPSIIF